MNPDSPVSNLQPFAEGDNSRTAFSAGTMNELVDRINLLLNIEGRNGIIVRKSDSRFVVSIDPRFLSSSNQTTPPTPPEPSTGAIQWKGQYNDHTNYVKNDIVRRNLPAEYLDGTVVGSYICVKDAPVGSPEPSYVDNEYWQVFAPFATQRFLLRNDNEIIDINATKDNTDGMEIMVGVEGSPKGRIELVQASCHEQVIAPNVEYVCDNGDTKQKVFLDSAEFI